jgi:hypothetical protein
MDHYITRSSLCAQENCVSGSYHHDRHQEILEMPDLVPGGCGKLLTEVDPECLEPPMRRQFCVDKCDFL